MIGGGVSFSLLDWKLRMIRETIPTFLTGVVCGDGTTGAEAVAAAVAAVVGVVCCFYK